MQEYLFNKEALKKLIENSPDHLNRIAVRINLDKPQENILALPVRFEDGITKEDDTIQDNVITGCPNPPGC